MVARWANPLYACSFHLTTGRMKVKPLLQFEHFVLAFKSSSFPSLTLKMAPLVKYESLLHRLNESGGSLFTSYLHESHCPLDSHPQLFYVKEERRQCQSSHREKRHNVPRVANATKRALTAIVQSQYIAITSSFFFPRILYFAPTFVNAATALSRCSFSWSAEICVLILA